MMFHARTVLLPHLLSLVMLIQSLNKSSRQVPLNGFEYFMSLEIPRKIMSRMTIKTPIPWGNIASKLFHELSYSSFNFGDSKSSTDSSISTKANSFMVDTIDMDEKFIMMEQTIEAYKKSIHDKILLITQHMRNIDLYNSRESHHNMKTQERVDIDSLNKSVDSQSAKHSSSVATL